PTPICNPGKDSIAAVLQPENSDDLYFVANGKGGHVFTASIAEHERNVARWRQIEEHRAPAPFKSPAPGPANSPDSLRPADLAPQAASPAHASHLRPRRRALRRH